MRAIAYIRVSTEDQKLGPEAQRASIVEWAKRTGSTVLGWYEDRGISGDKEVSRRPGLYSALQALTDKRADVLVVSRRDRLARDLMVALEIEEFCRKKKARVVSTAGEGTETTGPAAKLQRSVIDAVASYEKDVIRQRVKDALAAKKARGHRYSGSIPFGQRLGADGVQLETDDHEQTIIARVLELHGRGVSTRRIPKLLDSEGYRNRRGESVSRSTVQRILKRAETDKEATNAA